MHAVHHIAAVFLTPLATFYVPSFAWRHVQYELQAHDSRYNRQGRGEETELIVRMESKRKERKGT
jgi:hypothetical protein